MRVAFDDGPDITTIANLDTLRKYGVHGTFFLVGNRLRGEQLRTARRIVAEGHEVGNHTWSHARLTELPSADVRAEIARADTEIQSVCGVWPEAFRPPYVASDAAVREVAHELGHTCHERTSTGDYAKRTEDIIDVAGEWYDAGESVLYLHCGVPATVFALPTILANGWCS